jgi:acetoacetate decarboxylase
MHVYWLHDAEWFGVYGESAWQLPVRLPDGRAAVYSPFLVLGSDGAVAPGRERYGQPKKAGEVSLEARGDLVVGGMRRELVTRAFADVVTAQEWPGPATLELRPNAQAPVHLLPVREVVLGLHRTLGTEAVIHTCPS